MEVAPPITAMAPPLASLTRSPRLTPGQGPHPPPRLTSRLHPCRLHPRHRNHPPSTVVALDSDKRRFRTRVATQFPSIGEPQLLEIIPNRCDGRAYAWASANGGSDRGSGVGAIAAITYHSNLHHQQLQPCPPPTTHPPPTVSRSLTVTKLWKRDELITR